MDFQIEHSAWIGIGKIVNANRDTYPITYELEVIMLYKGSEKITTIQTGSGGGDCGFHFEVDEEYIIYGSTVDETTITTTSCDRTNKTSNSIDYDYLNKKFKDDKINLDWSESITNFVQSRTGNIVDLANPPIIVNKDYEILAIKDLISKHPNYYTIQQVSFRAGDLKRMHPELREKARTNGIIVAKPSYLKFKKRKLIRKLNKQYK